MLVVFHVVWWSRHLPKCQSGQILALTVQERAIIGGKSSIIKYLAVAENGLLVRSYVL